MALFAVKDGQYVKMYNSKGGYKLSHQMYDIENVSVSGTTVVVTFKNSSYVALFDCETGRYLGQKRVR